MHAELLCKDPVMCFANGSTDEFVWSCLVLFEKKKILM